MEMHVEKVEKQWHWCSCSIYVDTSQQANGPQQINSHIGLSMYLPSPHQTTVLCPYHFPTLRQMHPRIIFLQNISLHHNCVRCSFCFFRSDPSEYQDSTGCSMRPVFMGFHKFHNCTRNLKKNIQDLSKIPRVTCCLTANAICRLDLQFGKMRRQVPL